jgi:hypothetical protein
MQSRGRLRTAVTTQRRTTPQALVVVLAVFLLCSGFNPMLVPLEEPSSPAESSEQRRAATIRSEVAKRGVGARVRVKLRDRHAFKGQITQIDESSFELLFDQDGLEAQSAKDRLITIPFVEVEKIRGPRSRAASVAIDVGVIVAGIAALALIVVMEVLKHEHSQ